MTILLLYLLIEGFRLHQRGQYSVLSLYLLLSSLLSLAKSFYLILHLLLLTLLLLDTKALVLLTLLLLSLLASSLLSLSSLHFLIQ